MLPLLPHVAYVAWKKFGTLPGPLRYTISSISKKKIKVMITLLNGAAKALTSTRMMLLSPDMRKRII